MGKPETEAKRRQRQRKQAEFVAGDVRSAASQLRHLATASGRPLDQQAVLDVKSAVAMLLGFLQENEQRRALLAEREASNPAAARFIGEEEQ